LRKGLALLELLAEHGPLSLAQVERLSGLNRTMSYRLLRVMSELGYVRHDPVRHQYELGTRLLGLGAITSQRLNLAEIAWPFLDALREETQETIALGVLAGNQVVYLGMVNGAPGTDLSVRFAGRDAPHATSIGKAILAFLPEDVRRPKVDSLQPLPSVTPWTIVDVATLEDDLARTRERGYALEDEENAIGARGIGVPVLDADGLPVAAVGLAGPVDRVDLARADRTASWLWRVSREMSRRIEHAPEAIAS
jgi:DNA-binding IclR family transcriptional regulator